ncbi:MAG: hypothetical protein GTO41_05415 [Burkholderiales bacterium]|nr:hypothetical protein [Burkholderiales bacterium]
MRWRKHPESSNWGDCGGNDQLGRLDWLTPAKVKQGVAKVREGVTFCLSLPLDYSSGDVLSPRRHSPVPRSTLRTGQPNINYVVAPDDRNATDVVNHNAARRAGIDCSNPDQSLRYTFFESGA